MEGGEGALAAPASEQAGPSREASHSTEQTGGGAAEEERALLPENKYYEGNLIENRYFERFKTNGSVYQFKILDPPSGVDILSHLLEAVMSITDRVLKKIDGNNFVGIQFITATNANNPAGLSFRLAKHVNFLDVWYLIYSVTQSALKHNSDESFSLIVQSIENPRGKGGHALKINPVDVVTSLERKNLL